MKKHKRRKWEKKGRVKQREKGVQVGGQETSRDGSEEREVIRNKGA